jgi:hypothetical protein
MNIIIDIDMDADDDDDVEKEGDIFNAYRPYFDMKIDEVI